MVVAVVQKGKWEHKPYTDRCLKCSGLGRYFVLSVGTGFSFSEGCSPTTYAPKLQPLSEETRNIPFEDTPTLLREGAGAAQQWISH